MEPRLDRGRSPLGQGARKLGRGSRARRGRRVSGSYARLHFLFVLGASSLIAELMAQGALDDAASRAGAGRDGGGVFRVCREKNEC